MIKRIILIVVPVLLIVSLLFFFGYQYQQSLYGSFPLDGHIITHNSNEEVERYYFKSGTRYKKVNNQKVVFDNTDQEEVSVPKDTFLHYSNGSIATLKKAVILDLNTLNDTVFKYYSIFDETILEKRNNNYVVSDQDLAFDSFVIKISSNKYLFVADKMTLKIGDEERNLEDTYLEITFFDGNITRLENQELSLQNVDSNMTLEIGNVTLDIQNHNLYYDSVNKLNLNEITIDSDDNIEIPKTNDNTKLEDNKDDTDNTDENNENARPNDPFEGIHNGIIDTDQDTTEEIVEENARLKDPEFTVTSLEVGPYSIRSEIEITDQENLLDGDLNVKIIEADTNRIVYQNKEASGLTYLEIEVETLMPDTNYILVVNSDYLKNEVTYNRDFVQKTFVTEPIGINFSKDYATTSMLAIDVSKSDYSDVKSVSVTLKDGEQIIGERPVSFDDVMSTTVYFDNLTHNKAYQVELSNFVYENSIVSDALTLEKEFKTLKRKPTFGKPSFTIDKKNGEFILSLTSVKDLDNGISSYRYEIYDARTIESNSSPLQVVERSKNGSVEISVDNDVIERGVPYVYKVVAIFNDNDKDYEYETDYSEVMKLDGVEFPTVRFEQSNVTFERIEGNIIITDSGGTINLDDGKVITITYQDSVGNINTITTSGNLRIPFSVNNLRANETYNISIYATVNLQDGNPAIDNCYIGSVVVKTKEPDPFTLRYSINDENITKAFSITAQLGSQEGVDTSLEANTLTGLRFNIYSGRNTNGTLIKSVRKVDRDLDYYASDLQTEYYDNSFEIDPALFGLRNQDMTSEYYTIEVTGAYDYTDFENDLPINNNIITVKTNGFVPDLPTDPSNAIEVNVIRNKDAGDKYREELNPETIVGYQIKAGYDNSKRYAKSITYQLHDAKTGEVIDTLEYKIPEDGSVNYVEFYLKDGTAYDVIDKDFRRGNSYYFTYTASLDLNFDGVVDTIYPTNNVVLKSKVITPEKQEPIFLIYLSTSKEGEVIYKYHFEDVDNVVIDNKLYYKIDNVLKGSLNVQTCSEDEYRNLQFVSLNSGYFEMYFEEALVKQEEIFEKDLVSQYYESSYTPSVGNYHLSLETNHILITLLDYQTNSSFYNRVTSARMVFKADSKTITKDNLLIDNGIITVDLADLEEFLGKEITTELYLSYDNGLGGFESANDRVALQTVKTEDQESYYYVLDRDLDLNISDVANGSLFSKEFNLKEKTLTVKDLITEKERIIEFDIDSRGISQNYEYFNVKNLSEVSVSSDGSNSFSFDVIIPGVSLTNAVGELNIKPTLITANARIVLYGSTASTIKDNKIYLELYETNENATTSTYLKTMEIDADSLNREVVIEDLQAKTYYYFKLYAYIKTGDEYVKMQLYDVDAKTNIRNYYFKTLSEIGITDIEATYTASSYEKRNLKLTYELDEIVGYDRLEYSIYKVITNENSEESYELLDMEIAPDTIFKNSMTKYIPIPVDCGFETGYSYYIVITPYTTIELNGEETEIKLDNQGVIKYDFQQLYMPYIGISSTIYSNDAIEYRINVLDYQKVIVGGVYQVSFYDSSGNDITPSEYKNKEYSINTVNNRFTLSGLKQGEKYLLRVTCTLDRYNNSSLVNPYEKNYQTTLIDTEGINIGDVYASTNLEDQTKINLQFYNSYKLTSIDTIRYSIYNTSGFSIDNTAEFVPTLETVGDVSFYTLTLQDNITTYGLYYIQVQFLKDGKVISEQSLEYRYIN